MDRPRTLRNPNVIKKITDELNADIEDDWKYKIKLTPKGNLAWIDIYDEDGSFVGHL